MKGASQAEFCYNGLHTCGEWELPRVPIGLRPPRGEKIEVEDVRFSYVDGRDVLHGVDMSVRVGERIAMVRDTLRADAINAERRDRSWTNRLDYTVGRLELSSRVVWSQLDGRDYHLVYFQARRHFGGLR